MAYSDFTLERITKIFGINIEERTNVFTAFDQLTVDAFFIKYLQNNIPLAQAISTEKAKSEMIIAPVLIEVRRLLDNKISLFGTDHKTSNQNFGDKFSSEQKEACITQKPVRLTLDEQVELLSSC